jgi:hypothetical protein
MQSYLVPEACPVLTSAALPLRRAPPPGFLDAFAYTDLTEAAEVAKKEPPGRGPSEEWNDDQFDAPTEGESTGRNFKADAFSPLTSDESQIRKGAAPCQGGKFSIAFRNTSTHSALPRESASA